MNWLAALEPPAARNKPLAFPPPPRRAAPQPQILALPEVAAKALSRIAVRAQAQVMVQAPPEPKLSKTATVFITKPGAMA